MGSSHLVETVNINLEDFSEAFLTCSTCLYQYDQDERKAKLLPCSHSVCLVCLQQLLQVQQNANAPSSCLRCPMCREVFALPQGGIHLLPAAFMINQLLDVMNKQRKDVVPHCALHPDDNMLYCEGCDLVFCQHCQQTATNKKCSQHTVIPLAIALKRMSEIMLYRTKNRLKSLEQAQTAINEEIRLLDENADTIVDQINSTFQEVSHIIEARRRELLESVRVRRDDKRKVLRDQVETLSDETKRLEKELETGALDVRELGRKIREWEGNGGDDRMNIEPRENAFLRLNNDTKQLIQDVSSCVGSFGGLSASTTFPGTSTIDQTEPSTTHTESTFRVNTADVNGKPRNTGGDPISAWLEGDGIEKVQCSVKDNENGSYDVTFRVRDAGDYNLHVKIFGRPVKNSPFLVSVIDHHSPKWQLAVELKQPTRVCLDGPEFYVLDTGNNRIRVVKDNGDVVSDITSPCLEGGSAVGMAMVEKERIAVLNWKQKSVSIIDTKRGEIVRKMVHAELQAPMDLAVDRRGRLLVADVEKVFVFDPQFQLLFSFAPKNNHITCLNVGLNDDIMVGTNQGLQLFDGAGRFLREIPVGSSRPMLVESCAVCPSTGRIMAGVVDSKTRRPQLAVALYKGQFVFHIDSFGSRLRRPSGLSMGSGHRVGQCFVVDHACHTVRMYKFL
ncbi:unnamed protein product, partial [Mesorhabditis spiculigera]